MQQMAAIASRRFHVGIVPVALSHPKVALDMDEPADYRLLAEILAQVQSGGSDGGEASACESP
jgi:hypothetical protein